MLDLNVDIGFLLSCYVVGEEDKKVNQAAAMHYDWNS